MSRCKKHLEFTTPEGQILAMNQFSVWRRERIQPREAKRPGLGPYPLVEATVVFVEVDGGFRSDLTDGRDALDMVVVGVGEKDGLQ
jgi:hypothetical protein